MQGSPNFYTNFHCSLTFVALKKFQVPTATKGRHQNKANFPSTQLYGGPRNIKDMSAVSDIKHPPRFRRGVDAYFTSVHRLSPISWSKRTIRISHLFMASGRPGVLQHPGWLYRASFLCSYPPANQYLESCALSEESQLAVWP